MLGENLIRSGLNWLRRGLILAVLLAVSVGLGGLEASADSFSADKSLSAERYEIASDSQVLIAYSLDYEMDRARGDQTIEHYGEPVRDVVEQTLRNNVNHPNSKATAKNSYGRKSFLNKLLPERNSLGKKFSQDDFSGMRKIEHPRDVLKK